MKIFWMIVFSVVTLGVFIGLSYYMASRFAWAFSWSRRWLFWIILICAVAFMGTMMGIMMSNPVNTFSRVVGMVANVGIGVLMYLLLSLLVIDFINLFVHLRPLFFGLFTVGITVVLSIYSYYNAQHVTIVRQEITIGKLAEPIRLAQLTDLHLGMYWGRHSVEKLVKLIEQEDVDAVVITGDIFDGRMNLDSAVLSPFQQLSIPVYAVIGNHDQYTGVAAIKEVLKQNGIILLDNRSTYFKDVQLVGLNNMLADRGSVDMTHPELSEHTIKMTLPQMGIDTTHAVILLHHNPVGVNYANQNGVDLYLAGHTHGGQMFPATLVARMVFKYRKGLFQYGDGTQIYVAQGNGTFGPPMRLVTQNELTILTLK